MEGAQAVALLLNSFAPKLAGHRVKWFTDNLSVTHIVECGNRWQHLTVDCFGHIWHVL